MNQNTKRAAKNRAIPHCQSIGIEKNREIDRREIYPATTGNNKQYEKKRIVEQHFFFFFFFAAYATVRLPYHIFSS